ncbi:retrovirus-related Pol polyprotein from transposon 297 [Trichonephila clavipes]|nr:retrovirus-related Pol polyprotein from transposon 297 [Trichonephila clavipes]
MCARKCRVRELMRTREDEIGMCVGCLMLTAERYIAIHRPNDRRNGYRDFDRKSLAIPDSQTEKIIPSIDEGNLDIDHTKTGLDEGQKQELQNLFSSFKRLFSDKPEFTHVLYHEIDTGDKPSVVSRPYSYFQLALNPSDVVKTAFVTKQGTYAFIRMPFGLSEVAPNFQKAIDMILKPVLWRFVRVYMDDVIISSPSFAYHVERLREVFRLLQEAGLTLNKNKCKFSCDKLKHLGLVITKEGINTDESKVKAIVEMKPSKNSKEVSRFLVKSYADLCQPLYQLKKVSKVLLVRGDAIKKAITVLKWADFNKPNASSIGIGLYSTRSSDQSLCSEERMLRKESRDLGLK